MTPLEQALIRASTDVRQLGLHWALVGGFAVVIRAEPRLTRDIDIAFAVSSDAEAERVVQALRGFGYAVDQHLEHEATGRLASVRLITKHPGAMDVAVDLLFASSGIEVEVVRDAEPLEVLTGVEMPVARTGHLIALKLLAGREQDRIDLGNLLSVANEVEVRRAREAVRLIARRGYDRNRSLETELEEWLAGHR